MDLDEEALGRALARFFQHSNELQCPENAEKYIVREAFGGTSPYWARKVRGARFQETLSNGILFRPQIVDEICHQIGNVLNSSVMKGLMIKGPQGIGKSHSLVNTVLKLQSSGEVLVTFIPDCEHWNSGFQLLETICSSCGSTPAELGISVQLINNEMLSILIAAIDEELMKLKKKWVFVFDQITKLFVKPMNLQAKNVSGLAFPFNVITEIQKTGRITSVIAASASNEMAYKEHHEGFAEYIHRNTMTTDELCLAFDGIDETNVDEMVDFSGGVPLYARLYAEKPVIFQGEINESVFFSLSSLHPKSSFDLPEWQHVLESIFSSILGTTSSVMKYDKKFLVREDPDAAGTQWHYRPLFPAVLAAYRRCLWEELMQYVEEKERLLLKVCVSPDTTNDTRDRLFAHVVIRRCQSSGVRIQLGDHLVNIGGDFERFGGRLLPRLTAASPNRVYIPFDPNFPAIDLVWKNDRTIFGVHVHVTLDDDVASSFCGLCREANWFENFDTVYLLYLGPEDAVTNLVSDWSRHPTLR